MARCLDICVFRSPLLILTSLLFEDLDVLVRLTLIRAALKDRLCEAMGIGDNDIGRDNGFHDDLSSFTLRYRLARYG